MESASHKRFSSQEVYLVLDQDDELQEDLTSNSHQVYTACRPILV